MRILLIQILSLCGVSFSVIAQSDSGYIKEFIQEEVQRNISAYNLRYADPSLNGIISNDVLTSQSNFFLRCFFAKEWI
jgi:hypothetical protein